MPELPEVETMVRDLRSRVVGHTIVAVGLPYPGEVVYPDPVQFQNRATGRTVLDVSRRAKYASFHLDSGDSLIVHRGMTGSLLLSAATEPMESHVRALFHLEDGRQLRFNDPRKFGKLYLLDSTGAETPHPWSHMGPEPLDPQFTAALLTSSLRERKAQIKPLLLSQRLVAGLGNIYVDEVLHLARIHPLRRAHTLSSAEARRLHAAIQSVLTAAIERRGTTFSTYVDFEGRAGRFSDQLRVFHRTGHACPRCGQTIIKLVVGGRGTHVCPHCQKV
jgi:formamidopyrimidine-DNA glycosylase